LCQARSRGLAEDLPQKAARKRPKTVRLAALVLESRAGVLLARRGEGELFGGLWEPPCVRSDGGRIGTLADSLGVAEEGLRAAGEVVHVLSHRRLVVAVSHARAPRRAVRRNPVQGYDLVDWVPLDPDFRPRDARPHSSLSRKILAVGLQR
jgi:A/G-specific adenine glycosylase